MLLFQLLIFILYMFHGGVPSHERRHARVYRYTEQKNGAPNGPIGRKRSTSLCEHSNFGLVI